MSASETPGSGIPGAHAGGVQLDGHRLLEQIKVLAESAPATGAPGVTRLAWSEADLIGRRLLAASLEGTQAEVWTDPVGNLIAEWRGSDANLAPLVVGSHIDTVVEGGRLDGAYGSVAAFEILATLAAAGEHLRHPVRAVAWVNEEGVMAPPFTGSMAVTGHTPDLEYVGPDDRTLAERIRGGGGHPTRIADAVWGPIAGYLELHIEQGPVLDQLGSTIGVVTGITGARRGSVSVTGQANHAGTTPMDLRHDALLAALPMIKAVEEVATDGPADAATVGSLTIHPNVGNVVPGRVSFTYDIRSIDDEACDQAVARLRTRVAQVAEETSTTASLLEGSSSAAVRTDPRLRQVVAEASEILGLRSTELVSGAGHDAQNLALVAPTGMIFVPSLGGISHQAAEATAPEALVAGARTLLAALLLADTRLDGGQAQAHPVKGQPGGTSVNQGAMPVQADSTPGTAG